MTEVALVMSETLRHAELNEA